VQTADGNVTGVELERGGQTEFAVNAKHKKCSSIREALHPYPIAFLVNNLCYLEAIKL